MYARSKNIVNNVAGEGRRTHLLVACSSHFDRWPRILFRDGAPFLTRSTIEVGHFRYNVFWMTGLLSPQPSQCQSCFEEWRFCKLGPLWLFIGTQLDFCWGQLSGEIYWAPNVRIILRKNSVNLHRKNFSSNTNRLLVAAWRTCYTVSGICYHVCALTIPS